MEFEWDITKNNLNKNKHGISFEEARVVFDDEDKYVEQTNRNDEIRYKVVGLIIGKLFTVVYTVRKSIIRIISARRANKLEVRKYNDKNE